MPDKQQAHRYDLFSVLLHWLIAVFTVALFVSGLWMVDLGYYDNWYYQAPWWHKGIGMVTAVLVLLRWLWSLVRLAPAAIATTPKWQQILAGLAHQLMNLAIMLLLITGYLMVTGKGDSLSVFDWFVIPALFKLSPEWLDLVGRLHLWIAYFIIALASLHAVAALKHHFLDKDATLKRMFAIPSGD